MALSCFGNLVCGGIRRRPSATEKHFGADGIVGLARLKPLCAEHLVDERAPAGAQHAAKLRKAPWPTTI